MQEALAEERAEAEDAGEGAGAADAADLARRRSNSCSRSLCSALLACAWPALLSASHSPIEPSMSPMNDITPSTTKQKSDWHAWPLVHCASWSRTCPKCSPAAL